MVGIGPDLKTFSFTLSHYNPRTNLLVHISNVESIGYVCTQYADKKSKLNEL